MLGNPLAVKFREVVEYPYTLRLLDGMVYNLRYLRRTIHHFRPEDTRTIDETDGAHRDDIAGDCPSGRGSGCFGARWFEHGDFRDTSGRRVCHGHISLMKAGHDGKIWMH